MYGVQPQIHVHQEYLLIHRGVDPYCDPFNPEGGRLWSAKEVYPCRVQLNQSFDRSNDGFDLLKPIMNEHRHLRNRSLQVVGIMIGTSLVQFWSPTKSREANGGLDRRG